MTTQITALYVYDITPLESDNPIEPVTGGKLGPGKVILKPGLYRVLTNPTLTALLGIAATNGVNALNPTYDHQTFTKGDPPDPPDRALQKLNLPKKTIVAFMGGAGDQADVDDLDDVDDVAK